jgi:GNAT superfamily N-acetyltransferase
MNISLGKLKDIENFDELAKEHWLAFNTKAPTFNKEFLQTLEVVIAKEEETVGYLFFFMYVSPYTAEKTCQADMYYLKPSYRGKGIGTKMFTFLEQTAKEQGCKRLVSSINLKLNTENFYKQLGYTNTHLAVAKEI